MDADAARPNRSAQWPEFSGLGAAAGKSIVMIGHSYAQAYISMRSKVALLSGHECASLPLRAAITPSQIGPFCAAH